MRPPAAILSDLDGVLIDSGAAIERAWRRWAGERGVDPQRLEGLMHGRPSIDVVRRVAPGLDPGAEAVRVDEILVEDGEVHVLPGARELLAGDHGLPVAVVTSCREALALERFAATGLRVPDVLITIDRVGAGKPDPEGYRAAAAALGADPRECVVLEDAPAGIAAGVAAGAHVIGVTTTYASDELTEAHEHVASVAEALERLRLSRAG